MAILIIFKTYKYKSYFLKKCNIFEKNWSQPNTRGNFTKKFTQI